MNRIKPSIASRFAQVAGLLTIGVALSACGGGGGGADEEAPTPAPPQSMVVADSLSRCPGLMGLSIPASVFGVPSGAGKVTEAVIVEPVAATGQLEYCRVRGTIAPAQGTEPVTAFQVNLPKEWNFKTVQFGGAGSNQVLVQASGAFVNQGTISPTAVARGYATYGSDGGNVVASGSYEANPQAILNFQHQSVKRARDLAGMMVRSYYQADARRNYHIGGSKGGQEALHAVQRYYADFDGAVSYYPAAQQQSLRLSWNRSWQYAFNTPGGTLNTAKQTLLKDAVLAACDSLDGASDGIVSNVAACKRTFNVRALRCSDGTDLGSTCLSDQQITTLEAMATPFIFAFPMVNNVTSVGPWPAFLGGSLATLFGDGSAPGSFYRQTAARPEAMSSTGIPYSDWQARVEPFAPYDASNPNIDAFRTKGGKLLLVQGTNDILVPEAMTTNYFNSLAQRYGTVPLRDFARYYIVPGFGHAQGDFLMNWDALAALEAWVEAGHAPENPVATDGNTATLGRTRPMCEYPAWPKYKGTGDVNRADNYTCTTS
jgi:fermentation-respiration switch protein FrsA (DUF1100 family)